MPTLTLPIPIATLSLTFFLLLISLSTQIGIPLNPMSQRCMVAYTDDNYQTLKLDIKFPSLPDQINGQVYQIQIYNTQTHQSLYENIANGRYRKQMDLDQHAIYKFCFKLLTNRQINTMIIDYNSDIEYYQTKKSVKIPESLLKSNQTKSAYEKAVVMEQSIQKYQQFFKNKRSQQDIHFQDAHRINYYLTLTSYVEIVIVLIAGIYQFFTIRKFLVDKQYM